MAGVNVNTASTVITGVVPLVLPTMKRSSVFPATVSMMRSLNPYSPEPPLFASMLTPTAVGRAVDSVTDLVVAPAAIVPTRAKLGTKHDVELAATADTPELVANPHAFVTILKRLSTVVEIRLYVKGLRDTSLRRSEHMEVPATCAFGDGATWAHSNLSITFLNVFAIYDLM